jgi:2-amino-4-hydroxy-6-hydroxymethyldihydropteridine diphosphokinase
VATVFLGLGSNVQPEKHLRLAMAELGRRFRITATSPVYRNSAVGFAGDEFLNLVVAVETGLTPRGVSRELEEIHGLAGRRRGDDSFVSRTLDIDLLLYDSAIIDEPKLQLPREDVLAYSFVLGPLADIAPDLVHPLTGRTMADHWQGFDRASHPLRVEPLDLAGVDNGDR